MRAPFLRGGAVGRVRRKIVQPDGVVGIVEGAKRERAAEISLLDPCLWRVRSLSCELVFIC